MIGGVIKFGLRLCLFLLPFLVGFYFLLGTVDRSNVDEHYPKLSAGRVDGLFLGSSRMSQGLDPIEVGKGEGLNLLNFSFTNATSPYGPIYQDCVLRRAKGIQDGLFILELNPWILSEDTRKEELREEGLTLDGLWSVSGHPNVPYLMGRSPKQLWELWKPEESVLRVSDQGWVKVELDLEGVDMSARFTEKLKQYTDIAPYYQVSEKRIAVFKNLVEELGKRGRVVICKLPVSPRMDKLETQWFGDSPKLAALDKWLGNQEMLSFDSRAGEYLTHDGNHLQYESAIRLSKALNESLFTQRK